MASTLLEPPPEHVERERAADAEAPEIDEPAANPTPIIVADPPRFRWTPELYRKAGENGIFGNARTELIRGHVIMPPPPGPAHASSTEKIQYALLDAFPRAEGFAVSVQNPLFADDSEPQPDLVVRIGQPGELAAEPEQVALIVEVAKASLRFDRTTKLDRYAQSGYREYWIVNLIDRFLEVYRDPKPEADGTHGYGSKATLAADAEVATLLKPDAKMKVADLLPPEGLE